MALLTKADGAIARSPEDAAQLEAAGYLRCYNNDYNKGARQYTEQGTPIRTPCPFYLSPEAQEAIKDKAGGYYTCPVCQHSYDLLHELPWHGVSPDEAEANQREDQQAHNWVAGGGTRIGLTMGEQAQIGEDLVASLGEIPGYGPITWWHNGGATAASPLDGATKDWGIEVKTIGYDATHHRFVPGRAQEKMHKDKHAVDMGKKGVLGVLVLLDYRRSVADIYVREYPTEQGVGAFRSKSGTHLVKEVPFRNPFLDPHNPAPQVESGLGGDYEEDLPF